jgi:hypothetical protein
MSRELGVTPALPAAFRRMRVHLSHRDTENEVTTATGLHGFASFVSFVVALFWLVLNRIATNDGVGNVG